MKIVFFGTPAFASDILAYLISEKSNVVAVVTQPDKKKGRRSIRQQNVKELCQDSFSNIPLFQPEKATDPSFIEELEKLQADLYVVVAYGKILRPILLSLPKVDTINVHASLLPKYRGAAPIERALLNGETETGITIMKVVKEMDAGDIISQHVLPIGQDINRETLAISLCNCAKPLLIQTINQIQEGKAMYTPQDESEATYAPKITADDRKINWDDSVKKIFNRIRAFSPYPGAEALLIENGIAKRLKVKKAQISDQKLKKGKILIDREVGRIFMGCNDGTLELVQLQLEGKKTLTAKEFLCGLKKNADIKISSFQ